MTDPAPTDPEALATSTDLATWPGVIIGDDQTPSADMVLAAASALVRVESGDPNRWTTDDDPAPSAIKSIVVQAAARLWRNPTFTVQTGSGPFTDAYQQGVEESLYLTPTEKSTIARIVGSASPGLGVIRTSRDDLCDTYSYVYDRFSGETIPASPYPDGSWLYGGSPW